MNSKSIDYSLLVLLALLWGSSFTMIKVALEDFHPAWIVQTRLVVGGIILLIICIVLKKNFPTEPKKYLELLFQGCLQGAIPFLLISYSEQHIDSGLAGLLNTTPPMVVFIISVFILRTKPFDIYKLIGLLLGLTGVYTASSVTAGVLTEKYILSIIYSLLAAFSYGVGAIYGARFVKLPPLVTASSSLCLGALALMPYTLIFAGSIEAAPSVTSILALLGLSVFSTALASVIFFRLVNNLGPLTTTSNAYLRALFSIFLGSIILSEDVNLHIIIGAVLIFLGIYFITGNGFRNAVDSMVLRGKSD